MCLGPQAVKAARIRSLRRFCHETRTLVLTFDDGPSSELTPRVLDLLAEFDAKATFFLLGRQVQGHEQIVQRIADAGHEIGTHTQNHLHAWKSLPWKATADIRLGYQTLQPWLSVEAPFRPPYGKITLHTWLLLRKRNVPVAWWTLDSCDTYDAMPDPEFIADTVARNSGGVVLLHDSDRPTRTRERAEHVLRTTRLLLETARGEGLNVRRYGDLRACTARGLASDPSEVPADQPAV
jgi:peptidoglycan/xylan/chitin deacetylase (PgdA/CDA1 family)